MGYPGLAYLSACLILALSFFVFSLKQNLPKWWALMVLILPVAAPVFVYKSKKGGMGLWLGLSLGAIMVASGVEAYLYRDYKEKNKYSHLPPVVREMIALNERVEDSTIALYHASGKLDSLGLVQSRISDIKTTLKLIDKMRGMIKANQDDIHALVAYIQDHQDYIRRKELDWAFWIAEFYKDPHVLEHQASTQRYFRAFEDLLRYTHDNFEKIMEDQSRQHMANYDAYYLRYRGVADRHNRYNRKRIWFQDDFIRDHPEVKPFLPGSHHLAPFKFWDKFSF